MQKMMLVFYYDILRINVNKKGFWIRDPARWYTQKDEVKPWPN